MRDDLPDFDTLMTLAKENPKELERIRARLTNDVFEQAPDEIKRRLHGLQFRIKMELKRAKNPNAACIKLSSMMHDSFARLNERLNSFERVTHGESNPKSETRPSAKIIPFKPRADASR